MAQQLFRLLDLHRSFWRVKSVCKIGRKWREKKRRAFIIVFRQKTYITESDKYGLCGEWMGKVHVSGTSKKVRGYSYIDS